MRDSTENGSPKEGTNTSWNAVVGALVLALLLGGCGDGNESPQEAPVQEELGEESEAEEESGGRCVTAESGNEFCDETAEGGFDSTTAYETAWASCGAFSVKQVAREYNTAADPVSAAEGFAEGYRGRSHQAAFEGCLDGFED